MVSCARKSFECPGEDVFSSWLQMNCAALLTLEKLTGKTFVVTVGKS